MFENRNNPLVSIIFPVKNEGIHLKNTLDSLQNTKTNVHFEVIVVDDATEDGCCDFLSDHDYPFAVTTFRTVGLGAARARNAGAEKAKGTYYIFCDAHLFFEDYWIEKLIDPLEKGVADGVSPGIAPHDKPDSVGYGFTLSFKKSSFKEEFSNKKVVPQDWKPFETPSLAGGCLAISRRVFDDIGGFDRGFIVWGHEDFEISLKMWLFGYKCYIQPQVTILHVFREVFPYKVSTNHADFNMMRMAYSHFREERIETCKKFIRVPEKADRIIELVLEKGALEQREEYFSRRKYDDDWYFKRFNINF